MDSEVWPGRETAPPIVMLAGFCQSISGPSAVWPVAKAYDLIVDALNFEPLSRRLTVMSCFDAVPVPRLMRMPAVCRRSTMSSRRAKSYCPARGSRWAQPKMLIATKAATATSATVM